jgi:hypothetical protein
MSTLRTIEVAAIQAEPVVLDREATVSKACQLISESASSAHDSTMIPVEVMSDLRQKVRLLSQPGIYPEKAARVEPRETHMSWVFLTDRFVYKLKKPIRARQLDFSTIALREHFCREELRLNRRLAASVYLAVCRSCCTRNPVNSRWTAPGSRSTGSSRCGACVMV